MSVPSLKQIKSANQLPLNLAAAQFLKQPPAEIASLALMRWGLENGVMVLPPAAGMPDISQLQDKINYLALFNPSKATQYLEMDNHDMLSDPEILRQQKTPLEAAAYLVENLYNRLDSEMSEPAYQHRNRMKPLMSKKTDRMLSLIPMARRKKIIRAMAQKVAQHLLKNNR